jgi:hypothetical protein
MDTVDAAKSFVDRVNQDAVYVEATYSTSEDGGAISGKGGEVVVFGGEGTYKSKEARLKQAWVRDNRVPGSRLVPLATCSSK